MLDISIATIANSFCFTNLKLGDLTLQVFFWGDTKLH